MGMKKLLVKAVLDGAQQVAVPALVAILSISIVFVPVLLLTGAAKYLFTPLAMAVVFALLASYLLSRTLIPNLVHFLLKKEVNLYREGEGGEPKETGGWNWKIHRAFNRRFKNMRDRYERREQKTSPRSSGRGPFAVRPYFTYRPGQR